MLCTCALSRKGQRAIFLSIIFFCARPKKVSLLCIFSVSEFIPSYTSFILRLSRSNLSLKAFFTHWLVFILISYKIAARRFKTRFSIFETINIPVLQSDVLQTCCKKIVFI